MARGVGDFMVIEPPSADELPVAPGRGVTVELIAPANWVARGWAAVVGIYSRSTGGRVAGATPGPVAQTHAHGDGDANRGRFPLRGERGERMNAYERLRRIYDAWPGVDTARRFDDYDGLALDFVRQTTGATTGGMVQWEIITGWAAKGGTYIVAALREKDERGNTDVHRGIGTHFWEAVCLAYENKRGWVEADANGYAKEAEED